MALQSLLKGESICQVFLDVWKAVSLKPDSGSVRHAIMKPFYDGPDSGGFRHAIMKPFYDGVLRHPLYPPRKGHPHMSISHGATEFSEEGVHILDFGGVRHAITKPFDDGVLRNPFCPPPKGHPHMSIFHGATESSEGGIPGALGMRSRSPFTTAFYAIPSVHRQKDVSIRAFSRALQKSQSIEHAITKPFYDGVLRYPIYPPPKGRLHTSIFHGATDQIPGALGMRSWSPFMTAFYTIQAVHRQKGVSIEGVSIALSP
ncbi:hypothetical protein B9Z19DRAFT_1120676 [Tuber borchii]|uniref:Uncharacterized protein n=1 Tax=Tuber borchii TaxID=42251 RepID=A0A2T7A453_TUBBO|nr:hypothetical protein B9Z19DRAFT_1120676 [Tuber borchii]